MNKENWVIYLIKNKTIFLLNFKCCLIILRSHSTDGRRWCVVAIVFGRCLCVCTHYSIDSNPIECIIIHTDTFDCVNSWFDCFQLFCSWFCSMVWWSFCSIVQNMDIWMLFVAIMCQCLSMRIIFAGICLCENCFTWLPSMVRRVKVFGKTFSPRYLCRNDFFFSFSLKKFWE